MNCAYNDAYTYLDRDYDLALFNDAFPINYSACFAIPFTPQLLANCQLAK
jgi:hypothetical protein